MTVQVIQYRDFEIVPDEIARAVGTKQVWQYTHKDYNGDEDRRIGNCESVEACKEEIDERFYDGEPQP